MSRVGRAHYNDDNYNNYYYIYAFRCILNSRWFKQWKKFVGYESYDTWDVGMSGDAGGYPGPVDNSLLLNGSLYFVSFKKLNSLIDN